MKKSFNILIVLLIVISCQQVRDKGEELINKSVVKAKETASLAWEKGINIAFDTLVTSEKTSFEKIFKTADSLNIQEIE